MEKLGGTMKILTMERVNKGPVANRSLFTGPEVTMQVLLPESREFNVNVVHFGRDVRNKWHTHDSEQILVVTSGKGYIATETEKKVIQPGDVVIIPTGEKHWHGATESSEFSNIYLSKKDSRLTQVED
jgi:quercetin dioxygenase-like cupin family protein